MEEFYRKLLEAYAKEKGIEDLGKINTEIERIAYHESKGDYSAKQKGGGPGRGGLQFEIGENQGAHTAYNRLQSVAKMYGIDMPSDYEALTKNNYDVSGLSPDAQKAMFLANMRRHPKAKFEDVIKGKTDAVDFWGKFHQTESDSKKMEQFEIDSTYFDKSLQKGEEGLELEKKTKIPMNISNLGKAISSGSQIVGLFSDMIGDIKANNEAIDLKTLENPYGSFFKNGGILSDSKNVKTAIGPSHENAGIKVDERGNPSPFPVAEIEGMEKVVQFKSLPDLKGENYVFPKKMKGQVEAIEKKYQDNSKIDQNTKELELKFLKNENEMKKKMKLEKFFKSGGKLPKYENGNPIPDYVNDEISRIMQNHTPSPDIGRVNPFVKMESPRVIKPSSRTLMPDETKAGATHIDKIKGLAGAKDAVSVAGAIIGTLDANKVYSNKNLSESEHLIRKTLQSDTTEAQRQIESGLNSAIANLRNSATTGSVFRANAINAYMKAAGQKAALEEQETQRLNTNRANAASLLFNMGEMESNKLKRASIEDSMNRAALFGQISEAFENQISVQQLSNNILVARKQSREMMDMLKAQFPNFEPSQAYYDALESATTTEEVSKAQEEEIIRYKTNNK